MSSTTPHRHRWNLRGAQVSGAIRRCEVCGVEQEKVAGRWREINSPRGVSVAPLMDPAETRRRFMPTGYGIDSEDGSSTTERAERNRPASANLYVFTLRTDKGDEFEYQSSASTLLDAEVEADARAAKTGAALIRVTKSYVGEPVEAARSEHETVAPRFLVSLPARGGWHVRDVVAGEVVFDSNRRDNAGRDEAYAKADELAGGVA